MARQVELAVTHPRRAGRILHRALAQTSVADQDVFNALAGRRLFNARHQLPHAGDLHQVARVVPAQPGGVNLAHAFVDQVQDGFFMLLRRAFSAGSGPVFCPPKAL